MLQLWASSKRATCILDEMHRAVADSAS